tara:strand:+ start:338 stop:1294 length:957 start_codon:yes stop_codon:yes gene_type:complete
MKWKKLGKIFNPLNHQLPNRCIEFAQSPQTLIFDNFVRIYFSTREKDQTGKYLSHISFIDIDKKFKNIINVSSDTVIKLGELGCFDEHGIFPINIFKENDKIHAYTTGWNRKVSVSADASIGYATSHDNGLTFDKLGTGPILTSNLNEPFLVGDAFVTKFKNLYHMWYIYGNKWISDPSEKEPQRIYKIVHATSKNGINWEREGKHIITDVIGENECQALPTVIYHKQKYHMYFCFRDAIGFRFDESKGYKIGYAYSYDLINWKRDDENAGITKGPEGSWDSNMICYPHLFKCDNKIYLLYNGNEFGRFGFGIAVLED